MKETKSHSLPYSFAILSPFKSPTPLIAPFQKTGITSPEPRILLSKDWSPVPEPMGEGCRHLPPPPVRSQKKIPLPQIRNQNAILPRLRNPPINPPTAVTPIPTATSSITRTILPIAILRQKHHIPIHRHIHQHPSPVAPPPDAQHTVHPRHLQIIPLPARLRDPLPRHKPELRTTPGRKPLPLPQKLNPANPHKKSNPRKAEAKDIGSSAPERESQEAKCSSSFV